MIQSQKCLHFDFCDVKVYSPYLFIYYGMWWIVYEDAKA